MWRRIRYWYFTRRGLLTSPTIGGSTVFRMDILLRSCLGASPGGVANHVHYHRRCIALALTLVFALIQIWRVWYVFADRNRKRMRGCRGVRGERGGKVTLLYAYAVRLAMRRGKREEKIEKDARPVIITDAEVEDYDDDDRLITTLGEKVWHKEYMETYRHLREHGNSAFIFILELVLATLIYCVTVPSESEAKQLSTIGILFAVWAFPALSAHLIGQYLERRFSHFERYEIEDEVGHGRS
jgi:hypothetical protein